LKQVNALLKFDFEQDIEDTLYRDELSDDTNEDESDEFHEDSVTPPKQLPVKFPKTLNQLFDTSFEAKIVPKFSITAADESNTEIFLDSSSIISSKLMRKRYSTSKR